MKRGKRFMNTNAMMNFSRPKTNSKITQDIVGSMELGLFEMQLKIMADLEGKKLNLNETELALLAEQQRNEALLQQQEMLTELIASMLYEKYLRGESDG